MSERPDVDKLSGVDLTRAVCLESGWSWYAIPGKQAMMLKDSDLNHENWQNLGKDFTPKGCGIYSDYYTCAPIYANSVADAFKLVAGLLSFQITVTNDLIVAKFDFERAVVPFNVGDDLQHAIATAICRAFLKWKWRNG